MFILRSKKKVQQELELDKTIKQIAYKIIQVIVQSRLGSKIRTYCKPVDYTNEFGIAINDVPDVLTESKIVLESAPIISNLPLSIEISLKTVDGVSLVLENWTLGINLGEPSSDNKNSAGLYNAANLLLKSLVSVTRAMPAYKISRSQDPNHYIIYYRISMGTLSDSMLGPNYKVLKFGRITCRRGVLYIISKYRTNMVISADMKPPVRNDPKPNIIEKPKRAIDLTKPMKMGAFVDLSKIKKIEDPNFSFPENPPCAWILDLAEKCNQIRIKKSKENSEEKIEDRSTKLPKNRKKAWDFVEDGPVFIKPLDCAFRAVTPLSELAEFYRLFYYAPDLKCFEDLDSTGDIPHEECKICEQPNLTLQLERFESLYREYDLLITDWCMFSSDYICDAFSTKHY